MIVPVLKQHLDADGNAEAIAAAIGVGRVWNLTAILWTEIGQVIEEKTTAVPHLEAISRLDYDGAFAAFSRGTLKYRAWRDSCGKPSLVGFTVLRDSSTGPAERAILNELLVAHFKRFFSSPSELLEFLQPELDPESLMGVFIGLVHDLKRTTVSRTHTLLHCEVCRSFLVGRGIDTLDLDDNQVIDAAIELADSP